MGTIWKGFIPPKHSFISWFAIQNRLKSNDRLGDVVSDKSCHLCNAVNESTNHLLFECRFSLQIWDQVREWCGFTKRTVAIKSSIKWYGRLHRGSRISSKGIILSIVSTIYHIWRARNAILFDYNSIPSDKIVKCIIRDVCRILDDHYPTHNLALNVATNG